MDVMGPAHNNSMRPASFPLAHVTSITNTTLIHPSGINFTDYEQKLNNQVSVLNNRLAALAWEAIDENLKSSLASELDFNEGNMPSAHVYLKHKDKLMQAVAMCGWQRSQEDLDLLEDEVKLADNFKKYLKAVEEEVQRRVREKSDCSESDEEHCKFTYNSHLLSIILPIDALALCRGENRVS